MSSDFEQLCRSWVACGASCDGDWQYEDLRAAGYDRSDCQQLLQQSGAANGGGLGGRFRGVGVFSTWWTLAVIIFCLLFPVSIVAAYTGFSLKWKSRKAE